MVRARGSLSICRSLRVVSVSDPCYCLGRELSFNGSTIERFRPEKRTLHGTQGAEARGETLGKRVTPSLPLSEPNESEPPSHSLAKSVVE